MFVFVFVFLANEILTFVDICFNEYDMVLAISGQPHYTMCIWNFRTGQLVVQHDTHKSTIPHSLICSYHHIPQIVQFSSWKQQLLIWELCHSATGVDMHEVSKIRLKQNFTLSSILSFCYSEDNHLYAVDNYGQVSLVSIEKCWQQDFVPQFISKFNISFISGGDGTILYESTMVRNKSTRKST